jgi:hypothetical protein
MTVTDLPTAITDDEIRQWATATGRQVGQKGRISKELRAEYERMAGDADDILPEGAVPRVLHPAPSDDPGPPEKPARAETPPRRIATRRRAGWKFWEAPKPSSGKGKTSSKPKYPRIPVDRLIERGWDVLARMFQPVNLPVSRVLAFQAPVAGVMLEDVVKGTIVDLVLQPIARAEAKLEVVGALAGPPAIVLALQLPGNQPFNEDGSPNRAGAVRHQVLMSALEESLMMWDEVTKSRMADVQEKVAANEARRKEVQTIIGMIFAPPEDVAQAAAAEEAAMANAREHMRGT